MSEEPSGKRRKMSGYQKNKFFGQKKLNVLEPGIKGFLATCNFREKDCVRECYNLLNEYLEVSAEKPEEAAEPKAKNAQNGDEDEEEEEDIATQLEKEIKTIKAKRDKSQFQQVETKTPNCVFIKTTVEDPTALGLRILRDIAETKKRKTRILLRFIPIEAVCRADLNEITNAAGKLFDKHFLNVPATTFAIVVNKRYNNSIDRMAVIKALADIVTFKNVQHKVDLKNAQLTVVVEIIKGLCLLGILPDYFQLKKFNLSELVEPSEKKKEQGETVEEAEEPEAAEAVKAEEEAKDSKDEKPAEAEPEDTSTEKVEEANANDVSK